MIQSVDSEWDVVVIGGGPAASTVACLTARGGYRVLLLERESQPRFHVGESLIPACNPILRRLGVEEWLNDSAFPRKYSVQFVSASGRESAPFYFDEHDPDGESYTWQVVRSEFDAMLMENALSNGADVRWGHSVREILFEGDRAVGVRYDTAGEHRRDKQGQIARARIVIDASGQSAFLAMRLGLRMDDPRLKNATIWTYFEGAVRDPGRDAGTTLILQSSDQKSWFWYIPLPGDVVSVGCTGALNDLFADRSRSPKEIFSQEVARCPALQQRLASANSTGVFHTTKDFSYQTSQGAGPGWMLVGDALGFIDPVYSSGVFLALKSGEMAADCAIDALREGDFSGERLGQWQPDYKSGVARFRRLVYAFYDPEFRIGHFLKQFPQHHTAITDMLIGNVYRDDLEEVMLDLDRFCHTSPTEVV